jgi:hypothetical protein
MLSLAPLCGHSLERKGAKTNSRTDTVYTRAGRQNSQNVWLLAYAPHQTKPRFSLIGSVAFLDFFWYFDSDRCRDFSRRSVPRGQAGLPDGSDLHRLARCCFLFFCFFNERSDLVKQHETERLLGSDLDVHEGAAVFFKARSITVWNKNNNRIWFLKRSETIGNHRK